MIVHRHILQRYIEAMGYKVFLHRITSERVPGQVCGIKTKNADAEIEHLVASAEEVYRLCPREARARGRDAVDEVRYHLKRFRYDSERGVLYFPTVFWNAERFSSSFRRS